MKQSDVRFDVDDDNGHNEDADENEYYFDDGYFFRGYDIFLYSEILSSW